MDWNDVDLVPGQIWPKERIFFRDVAAEVTKKFPHEQITIVNIGIWRGASMHCFRIGAPEAKLVGIDVMGAHSFVTPGLTDFLNAEIIKRNSNFVAWSDPIHLLFVDGGHEFETVLGDIMLYCPYVVSGGVAVFHDTGESEVRGALSLIQETGDWSKESAEVGMLRKYRREDG